EEIKMLDNEYIKKAEEELEYLSGDEEVRRLAFLREKAIRDEISAREAGRQEGKQEGLRAGRQEEKIETAKKMLEKNIDILIISEITGLTEEEIKKIKIVKNKR
ncbi:MAG: Rpn family recombination-promoting nuclease/putative transposase, partial [Clostridia bacterium]|nr:Rpn family recombination-promoting nuclease/putative transposase [Clostridia bacterium]